VSAIEAQALAAPLDGTPPSVAPAAPAAADLPAAGAPTARRVTVLELLAPERLARTLLLWVVSFCFLWSSNGILFMLPTILTQRGLPLTQAIFLTLVQAVGGVFGYVACAFLIDRFGRRPVLFLYFFIGAGFHLWFALATDLAWMSAAIFLVGWVNPGVFGPSSVYVGELYPTRMRATAVGWYFGIGRIGSFTAPTVVGFMLANGLGAWVLYTFALTYLIASFALWLVGVETRGMVLEKIEPARAVSADPGR